MGLDVKVISVAAVLLLSHALCLILWISGWPASKQLDVGANNFYFAWGLIMSLAIMLLTVAAALIPVEMIKKIAPLAIIFCIILFIIPLSVVLGIAGNSLRWEDCNDLSESLKEECNGLKVVFVSSFFYMFVLAGTFVFALVLQRQGNDGYSQGL